MRFLTYCPCLFSSTEDFNIYKISLLFYWFLLTSPLRAPLSSLSSYHNVRSIYEVFHSEDPGPSKKKDLFVVSSHSLYSPSFSPRQWKTSRRWKIKGRRTVLVVLFWYHRQLLLWFGDLTPHLPPTDIR